MTLAPITHAIFDLDGTLLDTETLYTEAAIVVGRRYGAEYTLEIKRTVMGGDTMVGAHHVVQTLALPIEPEQYIAEREVELHALLAQVVPMPGAIALLEALRARRIPIAVATSGHRAITQHKLQNQPFLKDLAALVCGDDPRLERPKPAPTSICWPPASSVPTLARASWSKTSSTACALAWPQACGRSPWSIGAGATTRARSRTPNVW